jgi:hypothetical protein
MNKKRSTEIRDRAAKSDLAPPNQTRKNSKITTDPRTSGATRGTNWAPPLAGIFVSGVNSNKGVKVINNYVNLV